MDWRSKIYLNITQESIITQIANKEDIDAAIVRQIFKSTENIVFDCLSSIAPSEEINIKLFKGITIKRKFIKRRKYSKRNVSRYRLPRTYKYKNLFIKILNWTD